MNIMHDKNIQNKINYSKEIFTITCNFKAEISVSEVCMNNTVENDFPKVKWLLYIWQVRWTNL